METEIMNNIRRILLPTLTLVTVAGMAMAQGYTELDTDTDGLLNLAEIQVVLPELTEDTFAALDSSGDGLLDGAEITAGQDAGLLPAAE